MKIPVFMKKSNRFGASLRRMTALVLSCVLTRGSAQTLQQRAECAFDKGGGTFSSVGDFSSAHILTDDLCNLTGDQGFRLDLKLKAVTVAWHTAEPDNHSIRQIIVDYEGPTGIWSCTASSGGILSGELTHTATNGQRLKRVVVHKDTTTSRWNGTRYDWIQGLTLHFLDDQGNEEAVDFGKTNTDIKLYIPDGTTALSENETLIAPVIGWHDLSLVHYAWSDGLGFHTLTAEDCTHCQDEATLVSSAPFFNTAEISQSVLGNESSSPLSLTFPFTDISDTVSDLYGTKWFCGIHKIVLEQT